MLELSTVGSSPTILNEAEDKKSKISDLISSMLGGAGHWQSRQSRRCKKPGDYVESLEMTAGVTASNINSTSTHNSVFYQLCSQTFVFLTYQYASFTFQRVIFPSIENIFQITGKCPLINDLLSSVKN